MARFPADRFDRPPADLQRVGAHRAPGRRGRGWIVFAWSALATGVLVGLGVFGMFVINDRVSFEGVLSSDNGNAPSAAPSASGAPTPAPVTPPEPTIDPGINVVILNGTDVTGLAGTAGDVLAGEGWTVGARSNADTTDVATTTVYYTDASQEGAARGLAQSLGGVTIALSDQFKVDGDDRMTVVLGADYAARQQ
jgi:hypothetical protein